MQSLAFFFFFCEYRSLTLQLVCMYTSFEDSRAMFEMARLEILLHLFISIRTNIFSSATPITTNLNNTHGPLMERLSSGNDWHAYIKAHVFSTTQFKLYNDGICIIVKSTTLSGVLSLIYLTSDRNHICENIDMYSDKAFKGKHSQFQGKYSQICGKISKSYSLDPMTNDNLSPWILNTSSSWVFKLHVNRNFIINVTFLSLESRFQPSCLVVRAFIEEKQEDSSRQYHRPFCPGNPPESFFSSGNIADIHVQTSPIYQRIYMDNNIFNEWIGNITFEYQIQDNDLFLKSPTSQKFKQRRAVVRYHYHTFHTVDIENWVYSWLKNRTINVYLNERKVSSSSFFDQYEYLFLIHESKYTIIYVFFFQSFLGATSAIVEGSLSCNKSEAALIAYEGPLVSLVQMDSLLLRLQEWSCGHTFSPTERNMELKGRIGDMTIVLVINNRRTIGNYSLSLSLAVRVIDMISNVALRKTIYLSSERTMHSMNFIPANTYFYRVFVDAGKAFVKVTFKNITFSGYTDGGCTYGGIFIVHKISDYGHSQHIGGICSSHGAKKFQSLYGLRGITLTERIIIYLKQYRFLAQVHATLIFSIDCCFGWCNLLPNFHHSLHVYIHKKQWGIATIQENYYFGYGLNSYYRWYGAKPFFGLRRFRDNHCIKLQYIMFDNMRRDLLQFIALESKSVIGVDHDENISPSLVKVAFWNINNELARFSSCAEMGFRFLADDRNDEQYIYMRNPQDEPWSSTTFTSKLGIDMACLVFDGAFHIQAEDISTSNISFTEVGGYMYDEVQPIILKGVYGGPNLHLKVGLQKIGFQTPTTHPKCCQIDMLIVSFGSRCMTYYFIHTPFGEISWLGHEWFSINTSSPDLFMYRGLCTTRLAYNGEQEAFVQSCAIMNAGVTLMPCKIHINYRFSLHDPVKLGHSEALERKVCVDDACYISPNIRSTISWNDAQAKCEDNNGSLVSVNSDTEWKMLISSKLMQSHTTNIFYIGYRTQVNNRQTRCNHQKISHITNVTRIFLSEFPFLRHAMTISICILHATCKSSGCDILLTSGRRNLLQILFIDIQLSCPTLDSVLEKGYSTKLFYNMLVATFNFETLTADSQNFRPFFFFF